MTDLLYSYTTTVKFLGSVLGPDYEVVLQDLSNINHSVIAIENGHISCSGLYSLLLTFPNQIHSYFGGKKK